MLTEKRTKEPGCCLLLVVLSLLHVSFSKINILFILFFYCVLLHITKLSYILNYNILMNVLDPKFVSRCTFLKLFLNNRVQQQD